MDNLSVRKYDATILSGYDEMVLLAPYLGKEVKSSFRGDKGTPQYLLGLETINGIEGWSTYWVGKIMFWSNGRSETRWIDVKAIKIKINE